MPGLGGGRTPEHGRHILWVNHYAVAPTEGGGTRHFELAKALAARGYQVTIAASDLTLHTRAYSRRAHPGDRRAVRDCVDGVGFLWLWAAPYLRNDWRRVHNWVSFGLGVSGLDFGVERPDLVIGSSPDLVAALGAYRLARRLGVPFVFEVRDLWPESLEAGGAKPALGYWLLARVANYLYTRARLVVVLTDGVARYLSEQGVGPVVVAPNGVDPASFGRRDGSARDRVRFVYVGAHGMLNGLDVVLDAAEYLLSRTDIEIRLIGDGPEKGRLERSAAERGLTNVRFIGPVPKTAIPAVLAEADVGLLVLRPAALFAWGVSPNKLFDYLGAGLPVVTNVPGDLAAMLERIGVGETAAPASGQSLAEAMIRTTELGHTERLRRGQRGRDWVAATHARDIVAARLDQALAPLLERPVE